MSVPVGLNHCTVSSKVILLSISEFSIHSSACCVTMEQLEKNVISHKHSIHFYDVCAFWYLLLSVSTSFVLSVTTKKKKKPLFTFSAYIEWSL